MTTCSVSRTEVVACSSGTHKHQVHSQRNVNKFPVYGISEDSLCMFGVKFFQYTEARSGCCAKYNRVKTTTDYHHSEIMSLKICEHI